MQHAGINLRRERLWFWGVTLLLLLAGIGLRDPWPADEPRFALVAKQMVESGQWLFPMRGDELYPDKPPLFMWLQAVFITLTGSVRWSFLLPSLLASLGTLALVRDLGRRLFSPIAGAYAGWAVLFALQFTFQAKRAQIDPLLVGWVTLSMYGFLRYLLLKGERTWWLLGWAAAGMGVITKGVGVISLLVLLPAAFAWWKRWPGVQKPRGTDWLFGVLALLAPILLWLVPMLLTVRASGDPLFQAYADNILLKQTAKRYANSWHHHQPFWYFPWVMATQWLPSVAAMAWIWRDWRDALRARDARILLPLAWVALVVLFFSISSGKREVYVLPAFPMLCLAMSPWLRDVVTNARAKRIAFGFALAMSLALLVAGLSVALGTPGFEAKLAAIRGSAHGDALGWMLAIIGAGGLLSCAWFRIRRGVPALLGTLTALWLGYSLIGYPLLNDASSARGLMQGVGERIGPQSELALVAWKEQNLLMADRPARTFGFLRPNAGQLHDARAWQAASPASRWLLVEDDAFDNCVRKEDGIAMGTYNRRQWWLLPATASIAGCVPVSTASAMGENAE